MAGCKNEGSSSAKSNEGPHLLLDSLNSSNFVENHDEDNEYPLNTKPLENQVAGHAFKDGKRTIGVVLEVLQDVNVVNASVGEVSIFKRSSSIVAALHGMLKHNDGYVLKPVNRPVQGEKEIRFYEEMQNVVNPLLLEFKSFIPNYYGTTVLELQGKKITFLLLEDITNGFVEPCVMDLKIGSQTWEPEAPIEKQQSEQKKYTECRRALHFCIPGFQTYDIKTGVFKRFGKNYGKQLNADGVYEAFRIFFNAEHGVSEQIIVPTLKKLKEILKWWKKQNVFHIYSSSVLLAYDASVLRTVYKKNFITESISNCNNCLSNDNSESNTIESTPELKSWLRVYLIDFAHVLEAKNATCDWNYITGITSLINVFENLLL